ncbi:MAG: DUF1801 domain-containing protein [Rhizobiales bacterium]|nr:DUF1801 domain-containing protein [Hyphomicrobiales bacterium]
MSINPDVDRWLETYDNPIKSVVSAIRRLALSCDPRIEECIKWQAPTFMYKNNIASFFPRAKKHASLMFHKGAEIAADFPNLQGDGKEARSFKVFDQDDLKAKSVELTAIFRAWCDMKDADA